MPIPARLEKLFEQSKVSYEIIRHPVAYTAQELSAVEHVKGRRHAKVVMVVAGKKPIMAVVPSDRKLDLAKLDQIVGAKTVLSSEEDFAKLFPDCERGTMPPFGALYDLDTYVDKSLVCDEDIVFEAGSHSEAVKMRYKDYEKLANPKVGEFATKLH